MAQQGRTAIPFHSQRTKVKNASQLTTSVYTLSCVLLRYKKLRYMLTQEQYIRAFPRAPKQRHCSGSRQTSALGFIRFQDTPSLRWMPFSKKHCSAELQKIQLSRIARAQFASIQSPFWRHRCKVRLQKRHLSPGLRNHTCSIHCRELCLQFGIRAQCVSPMWKRNSERPCGACLATKLYISRHAYVRGKGMSLNVKFQV